ncbi:alpha/beta fold hydrolase [Brevundimonas naejangsanensis]|uniref:Alpha/beta fold hydrolase n=1 Tax=Brevundimonas naejangsanensis TaxID=588932 RepID=A0A494RJ56_9CAUL|nr:alpha/beta fold hydrolase [Brevundimonas naejangsanensis]
MRRGRPAAPSSVLLRKPPSPTRGEGRWIAVCLSLALAACATPHLQPSLTPPAGFSGPRIEEGTLGRGAFVVQDGASLPYLRWTPEDEPPWAVIVALHGFNDHYASFRLAGPWWATRGIETWAYDQRGFGLAPNRGEFAPESLTSQDLRTIVSLVRAERPDALIVVAGESMGGASAIAAFGSEAPPDADRVVLLAPAVWGWSSQTALNRASLWTAARLMGAKQVEPPAFAVRDIRASDNTLELIRNGRDPLSILSTRFDSLYGLVDLMEMATRRLGGIETPTLLLYGAHDQIIAKRPMRRALEQAGPRSNLTTGYYAQGWHILNRDLQAEAVFADVEAWLRDPAAPLPSGAPPVLPALQADPKAR